MRCSDGRTTSRTSSNSLPREGAERMRFGIVGLGRMGGNLARAAMEHGHEVVGYNRDAELTQALAAEGLDPADSLDELASKLEPTRVVLLYVPHGRPTDD